jgi:uncharacterized protein YbbC (DUF1343 family)
MRTPIVRWPTLAPLLAFLSAPVARAANGIDAGASIDGAAEIAAPAWPAEIDRLVAETLAEGKLPGCVVTIGRADGILYSKAFGSRALLPVTEPMTLDTIFDVASLTKPVATAASLMVLADQGKIDLDQRAARYLPDLSSRDKGSITLRQLLTHVSGLPSEIPIGDFERGRAEAWKRIVNLKPKAAPGERFIYSDVGFLVLEEVIRRVSGGGLDELARARLFRPLGMVDTGFLPPEGARPRIAPTEQRNGEWMRGQVHDPRAFRLGGVAGHAGLFSTAADLARFARMLLGGGALDGARILSARAVAAMLAPHDVPGGIRALGWDMRTGYSANRGTSLSRRALGHGGYTGTSLWIDPEKNLFVIFLSNRVHPDGKGAINALAGSIATLVGEAFGLPGALAPRPAGSGLLPGIDVLAAQGFSTLRGLRFALLTNDSARNREGVRTTDVLAGQRDLKLVALLCPEHGLSAARDERIADATDRITHLPVLSLYGGRHGPRSARPPGPRPVTLPDGIDAVVIDLPDVGTRFYTYASTVHATLRAAASRDLRVVVLDRPNPLGGEEVSGPVLKTTELSPVNHFPMPVRHGMTMGELATMFDADEHLGVRLEVVRMAGYDRRAYFDETGLAWWPPSPNLRTVAQTILYPAVGLLESTNVSVGRGTDIPFEVLGAPWVDGAALAKDLDAAGLAGVTFQSTTFTPSVNPYRNAVCHGVRLHVTDRASFRPVRTGIAMAMALRRLHPGAWNGARLRGMLGDPAAAAAVLDRRPLAGIEARWQPDLAAFRAKREKYLLYPP